MASSWCFVAFVLLFHTPSILCKCPPVRQPCYCSSTALEPVSIVCHNAGSLADALAAIGNVGNIQIDSLVILNTPISHLPASAFRNMAIIRLVLNRNGLNSIHSYAFDETTRNSISDLDLRYNALGKVPTDGVSSLRRLTKLSLGYNRIIDVPPHCFSGYASVNYLSRLDLSGNRISDLHEKALAGLNALEDVNLEANSFGAIPIDAFREHRQRIKNLNLGVNQISTVSKGSLDLPQLQSLSLEFNSISSLTPDAFGALPNLLYLYLTGNKLTQWDPEIFRHVPGLRALGMGEMAIRSIPNDAFKHIPNVLRLEMNDAAVEHIAYGAFQRIPRVQAISLHKNLLSSISADMFRGLNDLQALDLSNNGLRNVDAGAWANLPALRNLDISNNHLETLYPGTFNGTFLRSDDARVLYLCNNSWLCTAGSLDWLRTWLRQNRDIVIDKANCWALCHGLSNMAGWPLRGEDPPPTPQPIGPHPDGSLQASSIGWIILAVILAILLTSICLLALVRYFVSKRHKEQKDEAEEKRVLSSTASGYHGASAAGSAYPGSVLDVNLPPVGAEPSHQQGQWSY